MAAGPKHLLRALALLWARLGRGRVYVAATAIAVTALAGVGVWHLLAPRKELASVAVARVSPGIEPSLPSPSVPLSNNGPQSRPALRGGSPTPGAPALERQIAITDLTQEERRGPRGEDIVIGTIGLTSRSDVEKNNVEIGVFFFDLTPANEMRPTRAQVTYRWLTPVRDWSDPEPKYLAATYFKPRPFRRLPDELRYGGFIVRVYSDGKLQDERSQPETLLAALRTAPSPAPPETSSISPSPSGFDDGRIRRGGPPSSPSATLNPLSSLPPQPSRSSQPPTLNSQPSEQSLPNGIPIPGKPGFVQSPYDPKFIIDVRGFPPGTLVNDPNTNKPFRVP